MSQMSFLLPGVPIYDIYIYIKKEQCTYIFTIINRDSEMHRSSQVIICSKMTEYLLDVLKKRCT